MPKIPMQESKRILHHSLFFIFIFGWTMTLWIVTVYKIRSDGASFFTYFTNWNWMIQTLFFTLEFGSLCSGLDQLRAINLSFIFWIANGTTWLVFWLVFFMIRDNAKFFLDLSKVNGGPHELWVVLNGHALFHVLISISLLIFVIFQKDYVDDSVSLFVAWRKNVASIKKGNEGSLFGGWRWYSFLFLLYVTLAPLAIVGIYAAIFDIHAKYGIVTGVGIIILAAVAVVISFNGFYAFFNMIYLYQPKTRLYNRTRWKNLCW
jgi:hypothetical protein